MARNIEQYVPPVLMEGGLKSALPVTLTSTLSAGAITGSSSSSSGSVTALSATATTAGGATSAALRMGTANVGIYFGSGAPSITAAQGSLYLRTDGSSTSTRLYVNTDGATTWTNVTTAA